MNVFRFQSLIPTTKCELMKWTYRIHSGKWNTMVSSQLQNIQFSLHQNRNQIWHRIDLFKTKIWHQSVGKHIRYRLQSHFYHLNNILNFPKLIYKMTPKGNHSIFRFKISLISIKTLLKHFSSLSLSPSLLANQTPI